MTLKDWRGEYHYWSERKLHGYLDEAYLDTTEEYDKIDMLIRRMGADEPQRLKDNTAKKLIPVTLINGNFIVTS